MTGVQTCALPISKKAGDKKSGGEKKQSQAEIIKKAQTAYDNAQKAQKNGDWAEYGRQMNELEKYLKKLK